MRISVLQRIIRNGNSSQVTIPVRMMHHLRWTQGQYVTLEMTEAGSLVVRQPAVDDFAPPRPSGPEPIAGDLLASSNTPSPTPPNGAPREQAK